ncbi:MAG: DUF4900 domain-containing protein [Candidatus Omnitrophica bacterium]|nr:DUF4900 domain-containing protein [Candidatus Omnitrophota bacterium]
MNNKRGAVLVVALLVTVMVTILSTIFMAKAMQEKNMAAIELRSAKTEYAAEAGSNAGLLTLYNLINFYMLNTVNATDPSIVSSNATTYASAHNGVGFLVAYVRNGNTHLLTQGTNEAVYTSTSTSLDDSGYSYTIRITQKSNPTSPSSNVWDFPFYFKIQTRGASGSLYKKMTLNGDFTVRVQKDNFARYALFTNSQTMPSGTQVWFNARTNFSGPVFTNGQFNFAYNPSGTFYGLTKQAQQQARFYNNNHPVLIDSDHNGTADVPTFSAGFQRGVTAISMPTSSQETDMANQASASTSYSNNGIYLPYTGSTLKGGIYVRGDATVSLSVDSQSRQVVAITQGSTSKTITMDKANNQTIVRSGSTNTTYTGLPDGTSDIGPIIYVLGNITSLGGTVQGATQMTIASRNDVVIQNNLRYQNTTAASGTQGSSDYVPPSAEGYDNLLGLLSWQGNVRVGSSAPDDVEIDATVMAKQGIFTVDNYDEGSSRGVATVLGGVISNNYGAFGTFSSSTGAPVSGYGRNFVYDSRMETSATPPYFPTMNTFIAFTDDIEDKLSWQQGGF